MVGPCAPAVVAALCVNVDVTPTTDVSGAAVEVAGA